MRAGPVPLAAVVLIAIASWSLPSCSGRASTDLPRRTHYDDLVSFFAEWRAFQRPKLVDGVPDYRAGAMAQQQRELAGWQSRLAAIDTTGWAVPQQVDYQVVRAELNGLDFDHRVLRPWARNPAFYVTVFWDQSDQPARTMEERRNAALPPQVPVASTGEHTRRFNAAVSEYMAFLQGHDVMTIREDMDSALRARIGTFAPGVREFFDEVDYRDPEVMRTHGYHWFDLARLAHQPPESPIRRIPLLYNIFNTRTEGNATGWEELMLQAGMFDARPRSRELIYVLLAERAARALGDLRMHSNEYRLEQASAFASANTPRGWLRMSGGLVRAEQHLYLQQPAYGTSYLIGKIEIDKLLAARRAQLGDRFTLKRFMDEFNSAGLVPASLLRWELMGRLPDDVGRMLQ